MAHLLRRLMNQIDGLNPWQYFIKTSINMPKMFRSDSGNIDSHLKMEELRTERQALENRSQKLSAQQQSLEMMLTELTRCIKQMEFDIKQSENVLSKLSEQGKPHKDAAGACGGQGQENTMPNAPSSNK